MNREEILNKIKSLRFKVRSDLMQYNQIKRRLDENREKILELKKNLKVYNVK